MEDNIKRKTISIDGQHNRYLIKKVNKHKPPEVKKMNISSNLEKELQYPRRTKIVRSRFPTTVLSRVNYLNTKSNDEYEYLFCNIFKNLCKPK